MISNGEYIDDDKTMTSARPITVNLQKLNHDRDHHVIVRLGMAYNDLSDVGHLNTLVDEQSVLHPELAEIRLSAKSYLLTQTLIHLAGAIEIIPEVSLQVKSSGYLAEIFENDQRLFSLLSAVEQYFDGDKKIGLKLETTASLFRNQIMNFRDDLGSHYNSSLGADVLKNSLQSSINNGHKESKRLIGARGFASPRFTFSEEIFISAWQQFCMSIYANESNRSSKEKQEAAKELVIEVKDRFCEFASLLIAKYLNLIGAVLCGQG